MSRKGNADALLKIRIRSDYVIIKIKTGPLARAIGSITVS